MKIVVFGAGLTARDPRLRPSKVKLPPTIVALSLLTTVSTKPADTLSVVVADDVRSPLVKEAPISGMLKLKLPIEAFAFAVPEPNGTKVVDAFEVKALAVMNGG